MEFVQSLAGRAGGALERLTKPSDRRGAPGGEAAQRRDFASALALAVNADSRAERVRAGKADAEHEGEGRDEDVSLDAAAEAARALGLATSVDPTRVHRSLDLLDPEFRRRLDRVIDRMEQEFGHTVRVVETLRSQTRQDYLYEQGRSRPGQVVTWTRSSNHALGRAADVMIDGTYNHPRGYARLAQVAAEEGLRTLGARDPGHIELPRGGGGMPGGFTASSEGSGGHVPWEPSLELPQRARGGGLARVAEIAAVADVARVAEVAQLARVARVAVPGATLVAGGAAPQATSLRAQSSAAGGQEGHTGGEREASSGLTELLGAEPLVFSRTSFQAAVGEVLGTAGAAAADRVARVVELQDAAATRAPNHVVLRVENGAGGEDRVRVDLRGVAVEANIEVSRSADAQRLSSRLGELQKALESRGLEAESLRVRSTSAASLETPLAPRGATAVTESESARQGRPDSNGSGAHPDEREPSDGGPRRDPADSRQNGRQRRPEQENS